MFNLEEVYDNLIEYVEHSRLENWSPQLREMLNDKLIAAPHGKMDEWISALANLPDLKQVSVDFNHNAIRLASGDPLTNEEQKRLTDGLKSLMPWRKGPFEFFGTEIDTEWRSDWKWDRVHPHLSNLKDRLILDVGCGSGYHCWRMLGAGAKRVIGIDPSTLFLMQFLAVKRYAGMTLPVDYLPFKMEEIPENLEAFDSVFSMGVLYHRRSPIDHLYELKGALKAGGELVLETLVVDGPDGYSLMPADRYAMMRNVWFLPSCPTLSTWLERVGFTDIKCVDLNQTSLNEQRATPWMTFQSLSDFLDPNDSKRTIEGYPAPLRATFVATKRAS
ncbi:SAM-dependent tRNA mo(5)U34 methyltransferase [Oleiphilus messinensis]|uniref:tRNA U34 carboxymethyltransferase n=1 Tax=Oleiphilus messinensis TaxID=141451 RepID=A0A1Y0I907_9GAMM|nr:tRNA 5-methoxyuridine(34)/uridine 5-oxyacetic acid(34) synthase CmoB [Oleiphilus messinensis]ARU55914.1 SAM-dependent tRNA mo(5)U34 methyltransferase [Oleiphilus messinensis]